MLLQALLPALLALHQCYQEGTNYMRLYLQNRNPYLCLMSGLIVANKLCFMSCLPVLHSGFATVGLVTSLPCPVPVLQGRHQLHAPL